MAALSASSAEQNVAVTEGAAAGTEPADQPPATAADVPETGTEPGLDAPAPAADDPGETPAGTLTKADTEPESVTDDFPEPGSQEAPEPPAADDAPGDTTEGAAQGDTAESGGLAPDGVPVPQDVPEPAGTVTDEGMLEARREASFLEQDRPQTTDSDHQASEPDAAAAPTAPAEEGAPRDETAQASEEPTMTTPPIPDAIEAPQEPIVEDPPEPQRYVDITDLDGDPRYTLRLSGLDGQPADSGEVLHGDRLIATLHPGPESGWFARLGADGLPSDVTYVVDSPQEAAVHAAIAYSAITGAPAGPQAEPAPERGPRNGSTPCAPTCATPQRHTARRSLLRPPAPTPRPSRTCMPGAWSPHSTVWRPLSPSAATGRSR